MLKIFCKLHNFTDDFTDIAEMQTINFIRYETSHCFLFPKCINISLYAFVEMTFSRRFYPQISVSNERGGREETITVGWGVGPYFVWQVTPMELMIAVVNLA